MGNQRNFRNFGPKEKYREPGQKPAQRPGKGNGWSAPAAKKFCRGSERNRARQVVGHLVAEELLGPVGDLKVAAPRAATILNEEHGLIVLLVR